MVKRNRNGDTQLETQEGVRAIRQNPKPEGIHPALGMARLVGRCQKTRRIGDPMHVMNPSEGIG